MMARMTGVWQRPVYGASYPFNWPAQKLQQTRKEKLNEEYLLRQLYRMALFQTFNNFKDNIRLEKSDNWDTFIPESEPWL